MAQYTDSRYPSAYWWTREHISQCIDEIRMGKAEPYVVNFLLQHKEELLAELIKNTPLSNSNYSSLHDEIKSALPEDIALFMRKTSEKNTLDAIHKFICGTGTEGDYLIIKDHYDFYHNQYIKILSQGYLDALYKEYNGNQAIAFLLALHSDQDRDFVSSSSFSVPTVAHDPIAAEKNKRTEKSLYSIEFLSNFLKKYGDESCAYLQGLLDTFPDVHTTNTLPQLSEKTLDYFREKYYAAQKEYENL